MGDKWFVVLSGNETDLKELARSCTMPEISVVDRDGEYFLESTDFSAADNPDSIAEKAQKIVTYLNGAGRLAMNAPTPLQSRVCQLRADGTKTFFVGLTTKPVPLRAAFCVAIPKPDGTVEVIGPGDPVPKWMFLARSDPKVATALELLAEPDWSTWVGLYRMFEVVESDLGGDKVGRQAIVSQCWATRDDIVRFRYTACSPNASGKEARHGDESATRAPSPPPVSMPKSEARALVERIMHGWLRSKVEKP